MNGSLDQRKEGLRTRYTDYYQCATNFALQFKPLTAQGS